MALQLASCFRRKAAQNQTFVNEVAAHCATLENKEGQQKGAEITSATSKGNAGIYQANKIFIICHI